MSEQRLREALAEARKYVHAMASSESYVQSKYAMKVLARVDAALAAPIAAPAGEARDAARYRWIRCYVNANHIFIALREMSPESFDAECDAAMATPAGSP